MYRKVQNINLKYKVVRHTSIDVPGQTVPVKGEISKISSTNSIESFSRARRRLRYFLEKAASSAFETKGVNAFCRNFIYQFIITIYGSLLFVKANREIIYSTD